MDALQTNYDKLLDDINEWRKLVSSFSKLTLPKSNSFEGSAFQKYLELLNFLWTEYDYLLKGKIVSDYRKSKEREVISFDEIEEEIAHEIANKKKKVMKVKDRHMLDALDAQLASLGVEITESQKQLKDSAKAIVANKVSFKFRTSETTNERNIPFYPYLFLNGTKCTLEKACPGLDSSSAKDVICNHPWFPQSSDSNPRKKQKGHGGKKGCIHILILLLLLILISKSSSSRRRNNISFNRKTCSAAIRKCSNTETFASSSSRHGKPTIKPIFITGPISSPKTSFTSPVNNANF